MLLQMSPIIKDDEIQKEEDRDHDNDDDDADENDGEHMYQSRNGVITVE